MNKKITVHIFGNPLLPFDSLPIKLKPELEKKFPDINFSITDPNENIKPKNKELIIIDTVLEILEVKIFDDIEKIKLDKIYSAHDFDLGFNLKLLKKINQLNKVIIFGVPEKINHQEALKQLTLLLNEYF